MNRFATVLIGCLMLIQTAALGADSPNASIEVVSATFDSIFDPLLNIQSRGWLGADGAVSIPMGEKKTLWLFGDTMVGTLDPKGNRAGIMVRNTIGLHDYSRGYPGKVEYYWDLTDNVPGDVFAVDRGDPANWYWPGTGTMFGEELYLFLYRLKKGEGNTAFSFAIADLTFVRVANPRDSPSEWKTTYRDLGMAEAHTGFAAAVLVHEGNLYLLGYDDEGEGENLKRKMVLARAEVESLTDEASPSDFEYWSESEEGGVWKEGRENLKPLFSPGSTESSIEYHADSDRFIAVTHHPFQPGMYLVEAPEITGPWSEPLHVFDVPEMATNKDFHAYAMKSHPELVDSPNELLVTYVTNTTGFWSMFANPTIYYPRFVRVKLRPAAHR